MSKEPNVKRESWVLTDKQNWVPVAKWFNGCKINIWSLWTSVCPHGDRQTESHMDGTHLKDMDSFQYLSNLPVRAINTIVFK